MTKNPFKDLLVSHFELEGQNTKQKTKKPYVPSKRKLQELRLGNPNYIAVINCVNPFSPDFNHNTFNGIAFVGELLKVIPISQKIINQLDEEGIAIVIEHLEEGINESIILYKKEIKLMDMYSLSVEELQYVFTKPLLKHIQRALKNKKYSASSLLEDIYMNMPNVTSKLRPHIIRSLQTRYYNILLNQDYTAADIKNYKKLKYKPLDGILLDVLKEKEYKEFADKIQKLDRFLKFIDIPADTILNQSLLLIQENLKEVARLKEEWEKVLLLRKDKRYLKPVRKFHQDALKKILEAKKEYEELREVTHKALKTLAKVQEEYKVTIKHELLNV